MKTLFKVLEKMAGVNLVHESIEVWEIPHPITVIENAPAITVLKVHYTLGPNGPVPSFRLHVPTKMLRSKAAAAFIQTSVAQIALGIRVNHLFYGTFLDSRLKNPNDKERISIKAIESISHAAVNVWANRFTKEHFPEAYKQETFHELVKILDLRTISKITKEKATRAGILAHLAAIHACTEVNKDIQSLRNVTELKHEEMELYEELLEFIQNVPNLHFEEEHDLQLLEKTTLELAEMCQSQMPFIPLIINDSRGRAVWSLNNA